MTAPATHFRIVNEGCDGFVDQTKYDTKAEAEAAATKLIVATADPARLFVYQFISEVCVSTIVEKVAS